MSKPEPVTGVAADSAPAASVVQPPLTDVLGRHLGTATGRLWAEDLPPALAAHLSALGWRIDAGPSAEPVPGIIAGPGDADALLARLSLAWERLPGEASLLLAGVFDLSVFRDGYRGFPCVDMVRGIAGRAGFDVLDTIPFADDADSLKLAGYRHLHAVHGVALAAGALGPRLLHLRRKAALRWRVSDLRGEQFDELARLYQGVFGHPVSPDFWRWKYADGRGTNAVAWSDGHIVAHYGALRRRIMYRGRPEWAAQPADVLVESRERAVLTRRGPFYLTAVTQAQVNSGPCLIGFGFPGGRHMRAAVHLGLYLPVGRMTELVWGAAASPRLRRPQARRIVPGAELRGWERAVNGLWSTMARDLDDAVVGVRDAGWIRHRYLQHPQHQYQVHLLSSRLTGRARALAVTRREGDRLELVDMVCPRARAPAVVTVARQLALDADCREVYCWIAEGHAGWLEILGAERRPLDVEVPTSISVGGPSPEELQGRWWLMSGDTDFR